jgi:hypothetical protein
MKRNRRRERKIKREEGGKGRKERKKQGVRKKMNK